MIKKCTPSLFAFQKFFKTINFNQNQSFLNNLSGGFHFPNTVQTHYYFIDNYILGDGDNFSVTDLNLHNIIHCMHVEFRLL